MKETIKFIKVGKSNELIIVTNNNIYNLNFDDYENEYHNPKFFLYCKNGRLVRQIKKRKKYKDLSSAQLFRIEDAEDIEGIKEYPSFNIDLKNNYKEENISKCFLKLLTSFGTYYLIGISIMKDKSSKKWHCF